MYCSYRATRCCSLPLNVWNRVGRYAEIFHPGHRQSNYCVAIISVCNHQRDIWGKEESAFGVYYGCNCLRSTSSYVITRTLYLWARQNWLFSCQSEWFVSLFPVFQILGEKFNKKETCILWLPGVGVKVRLRSNNDNLNIRLLNRTNQRI